MPSRKRPASGSTSRGRPKRARTMPSASTATTVPPESATEPRKGAQLTLEPCKPPKKITNINQWISAFNTFVAIYVVRFPLEAPKLMKYCEIVRDIAAKFGDWVFYDEQFRLLRQNAPNK